ncbi:cytochrome b561 domain-containing protein At2g30890-like [Zingiber officinale]|uniref:Cytochrome b561 domain-containing protein n=1 Tax=Zingiber officinale TaxID=94328 RepID=A0A8J5G284_ZINOF|nr:cytochrome b561 domain-containing protein At2g30890-like [Zingiber officinale]KAG6498486.1 hypothetical protein ZIOFF_046400 [Zingiber officinale]
MINQSNPLKLTPELSIHIKIHGFLLWASLGFLMPLGVVIIRMSESAKSIKMVKVLFYTHVTVQILAILLATVAAVLSLINFENSFNNTHQKIGLVLYGLIWIQPLIAFVRPRRGMKTRSLWYLVHWLLGTGVCVLGIANIFIGLHTFHEKTSSIVSLWAVLFTAEVSFMAFLYLLQCKWEYVMKQGVTQDEQIRPADHASPTRNQKEMVVLP